MQEKKDAAYASEQAGGIENQKIILEKFEKENSEERSVNEENASTPPVEEIPVQALELNASPKTPPSTVEPSTADQTFLIHRSPAPKYAQNSAISAYRARRKLSPTTYRKRQAPQPPQRMDYPPTNYSESDPSSSSIESTSNTLKDILFNSGNEPQNAFSSSIGATSHNTNSNLYPEIDSKYPVRANKTFNKLKRTFFTSDDSESEGRESVEMEVDNLQLLEESSNHESSNDSNYFSTINYMPVEETEDISESTEPSIIPHDEPNEIIDSVDDLHNLEILENILSVSESSSDDDVEILHEYGNNDYESVWRRALHEDTFSNDIEDFPNIDNNNEDEDEENIIEDPDSYSNGFIQSDESTDDNNYSENDYDEENMSGESNEDSDDNGDDDSQSTITLNDTLDNTLSEEDGNY